MRLGRNWRRQLKPFVCTRLDELSFAGDVYDLLSVAAMWLLLLLAPAVGLGLA